MLISAHRDGDIISNAVVPFGIEFIRGSAANPKKRFKDKHGVAALGQMTSALKKGDIVGITPDGPRGPRQKCQKGIIGLAKLSQAPLIPVGYATTRGRELNSWDRFWVAMPFSKGVFIIGEPIWPPEKKNEDAMALYEEQLEKALNQAISEARMAIGRSPDAEQLG